MRIGIIHPGEMGSSVAASAVEGGHEVFWASEGRSAATRERAGKAGLQDLGTLAALCEASELLLGVCPPHAAEATAAQVRDAGFQGLYLDANAVAPERARAIQALLAEAGIGFVDGGIIGPPAWRPGTTWLYLSGPARDRVAACFAAGPLIACPLGPETGEASALKMCYAALTKGTTALLCAVFATAAQRGVLPQLLEQWDKEAPGLAAERERSVRRVTAKAWRFEGEMREIAATFAASGQPEGFHAAAAEIYAGLAGLKAVPIPAPLDKVLEALGKTPETGGDR